MAPAVSQGRFITLEGGEGAGKSTQARLLAAWIRERGLTVLMTREPGGAPGAEEIRSLLVTGAPGRWDPLSETLLHYAARREHMIRTVQPALAEGHWVICDRFADSTVAYQGYGQGIGQDVIARIGKAVLGDFAPDLTIVLDVDPETRRARVAGRAGAEDRYERMDEAFHARVRDGFKAIAAGEPTRCAMIAADAAPDAVANRIREIVAQRLKIGVQFDLSP
jgi:dTMP kinase